MSDNKQQATNLSEAQPSHTDWWGDHIADDRKAVLRAYLATWENESQRGERRGPFDGARLTGADVFWLAALTLAKGEDGIAEIERQLAVADIEERVRLSLALDHLHLEGANLAGARLSNAVLSEAHLQKANLRGAHLEKSLLSMTHLDEADLSEAHAQGAILGDAQLENAILREAHLEGAFLTAAQLKGATFSEAYLNAANLSEAHLEDAVLHLARLEQADLSATHLQGAVLSEAHLEGAKLFEAHLEGASLYEAHLSGADLRGAFFDTATILNNASLDGPVGLARVADVRWGGVNLAALKGILRPPIGDERVAAEWKREPLKVEAGKRQPSRRQRASHRREQVAARLQAWQTAVRANRQFAVTLQAQGMNEEAADFFYSAQLCQHTVLWLSGWRAFGSWLFSGFLDAMAGYGYRPGRTLLWYLCVILYFAILYSAATHGIVTFGLAPSQVQPLHWYEALILSVSSFHGRGFFQPVKSLGDPVAILAALEAVCGLLIEVSFISTFTQRFFGSK